MALRIFPTLWRPRAVDAVVELLGTLVFMGAVPFVLTLPAIFLAKDFPDVAAVLGVGGVLLSIPSIFYLRAKLVSALNRLGALGGEAAVGDDGIAVKGVSIHPRFIAYDAIRSIRVDRHKRQVVLELHEGEAVRFRVAEPKVAAAEIEGRLEAARAREAIRPLPVLAEHGPDVASWAKRARQLSAGGLRDGVATVDHLADLAADPGADPEQRIGAALALHDAPPAVRMRVCAAAEEAARPHLSEALTQAVEGDLEEELLGRSVE